MKTSGLTSAAHHYNCENNRTAKRSSALFRITTGAVLLFLTLLTAQAAHAQIYVDRDASGANDGTSWSDAYTDFQDAINAASGSDEIWIAEGVYVPGNSRSDSFVIDDSKNGLKIYGGFEGNESNRTDRNPSEHPTVLSGDVDGNDNTNANGFIISGNQLNGNNSYHVIDLDGRDSGFTRDTVLDGLIITGGQPGDGDGNDDRIDFGGGILCDGSSDGVCNPTLSNLILSGNVAVMGSGGRRSGGGGLYAGGRGGESSPLIVNTVFIGNESELGGAIKAEGKSSPEIVNVTFVNNKATLGGGAYYAEANNVTASPEITNSVLWDNRGLQQGGDQIDLFSFNGSLTLTVSNSLLEGGLNAIDTSSNASVNDGGNNLSSNPDFVNASVPFGDDGVPATTDDGLRAFNLSPAINAGDNNVVPGGISTDIRGTSRIQNGTVDLGAYEGGVALTDFDLVISPDRQTQESGENATFTITVNNNGPDDAASGASVDLSTSGLSGLTQTEISGGSFSGTEWSLPALDAGESATLMLNAVYDGTDPATLDATVNSPQSGDPEAGNNSYSAQVSDPPYGPERALTFDGNTDALNAGPDIRLDDRSFSISFWAKRSESGNHDFVVGQGTESQTNQSLHIGFEDSDHFTFDFYGNDLTTTETYTDDSWSHWAVTYDANTRRRHIYRNGRRVTSGQAPENYLGSGDFLIGKVAFENARHFNGEIDQLRVWNKALSETEIKARLNRTINPGDTAFDELISSFRFDAGTGSTAYDYAGSNSATFIGNPEWSSFSGANIGQESAVATSSVDATVGPAGASLSVDAFETFPIYRYGKSDGPLRTDADAGESLTGSRANIVWGIYDPNSLARGTMTIDYSNVQGLDSSATLLRRERPGEFWTSAWTWDHDSENKQFTGDFEIGEFAIGTPPVYYVNAQNGDDSNNGRSWEQAFASLDKALSVARKRSEIWIAQGIYRPSGDSFMIDGQTQAGIKIYGGFDGGESSIEERDPESNLTILSGDIGEDDTVNSDGITEKAAHIQGENSTHVLHLDGGDTSITPETIIDGLTVTAGQASEAFNPGNLGGGIYCEAVNGGICSPTLSNISIVGNHADLDGGGLHADGKFGGISNPVIVNAIFSGNHANRNGGAFQSDGEQGESNSVVVNTFFSENTADAGGALTVRGDGGAASVKVSNAVFADNAPEHVYYVKNDNGTQAHFSSSTFTGAERAFRNTNLDENQIRITNSIFWDNEGDIANVDAPLDIRYSIVEEASYAEGGSNGGVGNINTDPLFVNADNPEGNDGLSGSDDDGLRVFQVSPAVNAGNIDDLPEDIADIDGDGDTTEKLPLDITGSERIQNGSLSMGAYAGTATAPVISGFSPAAARPNDLIRITGENFPDAPEVSIGGITAAIQSSTSSEIIANIPDGSTGGAVKVGFVSADEELYVYQPPYGSEQALRFDGTEDWLRADAVSDAVAAGNSFSMSAWVRPGSDGLEKQTVMGFYSGDGANLNIITYRKSAEAFYYFDDDNGETLADFTSAPDEWHHVAATISDNGDGHLYVNGREAASFTTTVRPEENGRFAIAMDWDDDTKSDFWDGEIDQLSIWNTDLSQTEVRARMHQTLDPDAVVFDDLIASYRFDAGEGSLAYDYAGSFSASFEGDPQWTGFSGALLGQEQATASDGSDASVGDDNASLSATSVSTGDAFQLYRYGNLNQTAVQPDAQGEDAGNLPAGYSQRSNLVWAVAVTEDTNPDATLRIDYSAISDAGQLSGVLSLIRRERPGMPWELVNSWTKDPDAKTYTYTGAIESGEYALAQILEADLALNLSADVKQLETGGSAVFTASVTNNGPENVDAAVVNFTPGDGLGTLNEVTSTTGNLSGNEWSIGSLAAGSSASIELSGNYEGPQPGVLEATISDDGTVDDTPENNGASARVIGFPYGSGAALAFDGNGDALQATIEQNPGPFTAEAWVRVTDVNAGVQGIINRDFRNDDREARSWKLGLDSDGRTLILDVFTDDTNYESAVSSKLLVEGQWHHVAGVFDGTNLIVYVDGIQTGEQPLGASTWQETDAHLRIGTDACCIDDRDFKGDVDQVRIWNTALSASEIRKRMHRTIAPTETAFNELIASYRFDSGTSTTAYDYVGTSDASFEGDPQWVSVSGAPVGQQGVAAAVDGNAEIGPENGTLSISEVGGQPVRAYLYGEPDDELINDGERGDSYSAALDGRILRRSNLVWGIGSGHSESTDAAIQLDYSLVNAIEDLPEQPELLYRSGPDQPWSLAEGWTREPAQQRFSFSGSLPEGELALAQLPETDAEITGPTPGWRMLGAPGPAARYNDVLDGLWTQGFPGATNDPDADPNVFFYDEATRSWAPPQHATNLLGSNQDEGNATAGAGILMYVYGEEWPQPLQYTGLQNDGEVSLNLANTPQTPDDGAQGWHLVSNPYPFAIDWMKVVNDGLDKVSPVMFLYDANTMEGEGGYRVHYGFNIPSLPGSVRYSGIIPAFQGFWARTEQMDGTEGTLTFKPSHAADEGDEAADLFAGEPGNTGASSNAIKEHIVLSLAAETSPKQAVSVLRIAEREAFQTKSYAAPAPLNSGGLQLSLVDSSSAHHASLIEQYMEPGETYTFGLQASGPAGEYKIEAPSIEEFPADARIWLTDQHTGERQELTESDSYVFTLSPEESDRGASENEESGKTASAKKTAKTDTRSIVSENRAVSRPEQARALPLPVPPGGIGGADGASKEDRRPEVRFLLEVEYGISTAGEPPQADLPREFTLRQNYPNPFNPVTTISYDLPEAVQVRLEVFNMLGQRVATLINERQPAGEYQHSFDASALSSGTYLYRLRAGEYTESRKMMLVK
jgi:uncharacterized repeat protein (TIGR01451 family)